MTIQRPGSAHSDAVSVTRVASGRHATKVDYAAFSADGRRAITAGADGDAITWDVRRARATGTLEGHAGRISAVALARDGTTLYTADELYDTASYADSLDARAYSWSRERHTRQSQ